MFFYPTIFNSKVHFFAFSFSSAGIAYPDKPDFNFMTVKRKSF